MPQDKQSDKSPEAAGHDPGVSNRGPADDPHRPSPDGAREDEVDRDADEGGDLLSHFVQRTDNSYAGIVDKRLLGEDIGDDEVDEDGEPV